ncbi:MAG: hypothetical protein RLN74_06345 [Ilumatobacter fluminis]
MRYDLRRLAAVCALAGVWLVAPTGSAEAAAVLELDITATSTPSTWLEDRTYAVVLANTGDAPVSDVTGLVSSPEVPLLAPGFGTPIALVGDADAVLEPGEQWQYTVTVPTISQWVFSAEGTAPGGPVTASATSLRATYSAAFAMPVSIGIDNESGPVAAGTVVPFDVTVANVAPFDVTLDCGEALDDAALATTPTPIGAPTGDEGADSLLTPGEVWAWALTHPVVESGSVLHVVCDVDRADTPTGGLRLAASGPIVTLTETALVAVTAEPTSPLTHWLQDRDVRVEVTNPGSLPISDVAVTVAMQMPPDGYAGSISAPTVSVDDDVLDPGEVWVYDATAIVWDTSTFTVTGVSSGGDDVTASDTVANGLGSDLLGAITIDVEQITTAPTAGRQVEWRVLIANAVGVELDITGFGATVVAPGASNASPGLDDPGEVGLGRPLGPNEEWSFVVDRPVALDGSVLAVRFGVARVDAPGAQDGGESLRSTSDPVTFAPAELPPTGTGATLPLTAALLVVAGAVLVAASRPGRSAGGPLTR